MDQVAPRVLHYAGGEGQGEGPSVLAVLGVGGLGSLGPRRMRARRQEGPEEQQGGLGRRRQGMGSSGAGALGDLVAQDECHDQDGV